MFSTASLSRRLVAFAVDYLVILAYVALLTAATWGLTRLPGAPEAMASIFSQPGFFDLFGFATLVLPVTLYFALMEGSKKGASLGKRRLGIKVVSADGGRLGYGRSLLRSAIKFLPWQVAHTSLFHIPGWPAQVEKIPAASIAGFVVVWLLVILYLGCQILRCDHRTFYDLLSGAMVVYQPELEQVKDFGPEST